MQVRAQDVNPPVFTGIMIQIIPEHDTLQFKNLLEVIISQ